jgi:hypothetical protein
MVRNAAGQRFSRNVREAQSEATASGWALGLSREG